MKEWPHKPAGKSEAKSIPRGKSFRVFPCKVSVWIEDNDKDEDSRQRLVVFCVEEKIFCVLGTKNYFREEGRRIFAYNEQK